MKSIYIATKNIGKVKEFQVFFNQYEIEVKSLLDINQDIEIEETGSTFEENALIKAHAVCQLVNMPVLADDSGLEVDILNNEPGIYSARYAGIHGDDLQNNLKIIDQLKNVPFEKRTARFVCALAIVYPTSKEIVVRGTCEGYMFDRMRGENGFGYDPLFYVPSLSKTYAELTNDEKMRISHRGDALRKLNGVFIND